MISRWAPTNENHTENYIRVVAERAVFRLTSLYILRTER